MLAAVGWNGARAQDTADLTMLSLEELMDIEVISVSKSLEKRFEAPAALYVLTAEDIRRSGATNIPSALRMVPGVEVAQINSSQWSVGIRGLGTGLARYTLVMIDGRSVYNPLFAGTYWDAQDTLLEDIDRIEVIRGPGGSLWGSNAVNGVINIITKKSKETQGVLLTGGGGSEEKGFGSFRYGGRAGEDFHYRFYGKYSDRDASHSEASHDYDAWQIGQGGFRTDWDLGEHQTITVQGDAYQENAGLRKVNYLETSPFVDLVEEHDNAYGENVLGRWTGDWGPASQVSLQAYYDRTARRDASFHQKVHTMDTQFQHSFSLYPGQRFTYGFGFRRIKDDTEGIPTFAFDPPGMTYDLWNIFAQEQLPLVRDRLTMTLGSKAEHNEYTGWEHQPNARLAWTPSASHTIWSAASRAVRTPSRLDRNPRITFLSTPPPPILQAARYTPNENYGSEDVVAYEMGYRVKTSESFFASVDGFFNRYDDVQSLFINTPFVEITPPPVKFVFPFIFENRVRGKIYGGEFNTVYTPVPWWRLEGVYSYARIILENKEGSQDGVTVPSKEGSTPRHQVVLRSSMDLPHGFEIDPTARYVGPVPFPGVPAYWTMDLRLGWGVSDSLELSVVGQNLFQERHAESNENVNEIQRGVYGKITWRWQTS